MAETGSIAGKIRRNLEAVTVAEWIMLSVIVFLAMSYFWLLDDAFVYFRYVDNFVFLRIGLVYNANEYVEGYSSPLWVMALSGLRALGLNFLSSLEILALFSVVAFWFLLVLLNRHMSPDQSTRFNFPLLFLGTNYAVNCYFSSGVETPLVQVMGVVCALNILRPSWRWPQLLFGLAPLLRHELLLPVFFCVIWSYFRTRRLPWVMLLTVLFTLGGWVLFRIYYYADLLPNTFYLKNEIDLAQGWRYVRQVLVPYHVGPIFLFFTALALALKYRGSRFFAIERVAMVVAAAIVTLYVVKVGGDARHYRYLAFPFVLFFCASGGLLEHAAKQFAPRVNGAWAAGIVLAVAGGSFFLYPPQLGGHVFRLEDTVHGVDKISDAHWHRYNSRFEFSEWGRAVNKSKLIAYRESSPHFSYRHIRAEGLCVAAYEDFDQQIVHNFGLTDAYLARVNSPSIRPGHKFGLFPAAAQLVELYRAGKIGRRGGFRSLVESGEAPEWIAAHVDTFDVIEKKVHNRHDFMENLRLAFTFPPRIDPIGVPMWIPDDVRNDLKRQGFSVP